MKLTINFYILISYKILIVFFFNSCSSKVSESCNGESSGKSYNSYYNSDGTLEKKEVVSNCLNSNVYNRYYNTDEKSGYVGHYNSDKKSGYVECSNYSLELCKGYSSNNTCSSFCNSEDAAVIHQFCSPCIEKVKACRRCL